MKNTLVLKRLLALAALLLNGFSAQAQELNINYSDFLILNSGMWSELGIAYRHDETILIDETQSGSTLVLRGWDANLDQYLYHSGQLVLTDVQRFTLPSWANFIAAQADEIRRLGGIPELSDASVVIGQVNGQAILAFSLAATVLNSNMEPLEWKVFSPLQAFSSLSAAQAAAQTLISNIQFSLEEQSLSCNTIREGQVFLGNLGGPPGGPIIAIEDQRVPVSIIACGSALTAALMYQRPGG